MRAAPFIAILFAGVFVASLANELSGRAADGQAADPGLDPTSRSAGVAWLTKNPDGHFYAEAMVEAQPREGSRVRFMVDTGASTIALTRADAVRVGLDVDSLAFTTRVATASGTAAAARVRLAQVTVSGVEIDDVDAIVMDGGLSQSLLGMSYLGRLSKMETNGDALILRR
jgi:aspartyl protease family protein